MAARGYVVLYTNPRGSTSYGEEFGNLIHHAYPGDDFYDLNSGVDAMLAKGYVDPDQLYVTGGSGGGVLTCWMIGRTDAVPRRGDRLPGHQLVQLRPHRRHRRLHHASTGSPACRGTTSSTTRSGRCSRW